VFIKFDVKFEPMWSKRASTSGKTTYIAWP